MGALSFRRTLPSLVCLARYLRVPVSTEHPRRGDPSPRNIRVAAAEYPRPVSAEYPRRGRGISATRLRGMSARAVVRGERRARRKRGHDGTVELGVPADDAALLDAFRHDVPVRASLLWRIGRGKRPRSRQKYRKRSFADDPHGVGSKRLPRVRRPRAAAAASSPRRGREARPLDSLFQRARTFPLGAAYKSGSANVPTASKVRGVSLKPAIGNARCGGSGCAQRCCVWSSPCLEL